MQHQSPPEASVAEENREENCNKWVGGGQKRRIPGLWLGCKRKGQQAEFCFTTQHLLGVGGGGVILPSFSSWAKFFSGPLASQKFSLAPSAQVSSGPKISSAPWAPLITQGLLWGGGGPPCPPPPVKRCPQGPLFGPVG